MSDALPLSVSAVALRDAARRWAAEGRAAVVVEVVESAGSAPRDAGTRMLVAGDAALGTIGGGHLEWQAVARAREGLASGSGRAFEERYALGPTLGQCCGGAVTLRFTPLDAAALAAWPPPAPRFHLQLYGAGHVGRAVVRLLASLPCTVQWIDEREDAFPDAPLPAHIERLCVEPVEAEVDPAPPAACYLVMTHQHDLDLRITEAILRRGDFRHLGLIGSRTKRARFEHRLRERGVAADAIARLRCPIGLDGIRGKEPEVIAIAAVAELLQATS